MSEIQIKAESFPQRCEICHKTDYFDSSNNICMRCEELYLQKDFICQEAKQNSITKYSIPKTPLGIIEIIERVYLIASFIPFLNLAKTFIVDDGLTLFVDLSFIFSFIGLVLWIVIKIKKKSAFVTLLAIFISLSPIFVMVTLLGIESIDIDIYNFVKKLFHW